MKPEIKKALRTTKFAKKEDNADNWYTVNADGKILGRMASEIAKRIRGKMNPKFTPNSDLGDFIVVINAEKVKVTGKRGEQKTYLTHSGYPGGQKEKTFKELLEKNPEKIIKLAVKRMLPKNKIGARLISKLKVYRGPDNPHSAQKPVELNI